MENAGNKNPSPKKDGFFSTIKKNALIVNQAAAGAGVTGLVGFGALFIVSGVFFLTENYFVSMLGLSLALLVYVSGADLMKIMMSSFTIFFSSKHLIPKATYLQETLVGLRDVVQLRRNSKGEIVAGPIRPGAKVELPDNALVKDIQRLIQENKDFNYAEFVAHSYYVECHELYDYSSANLDFVSNVMPVFGLIGTILGLIGMFDNLGGDVTVEALAPQLALAFKTTLYGAVFSSLYKIVSSRFELRLKSLDYDYETFCRALQVLVDSKTVVEVQG